MTTRAQRRTQDATREHEHRCELDASLDTRVCLGRGYHECQCGATCGVAKGSEWIKSHATPGDSYLRSSGWFV